VFGIHIKFCNFLLKNLATLYDGACVLFITGRIPLVRFYVRVEMGGSRF
jgi:hypothetical protein